jgi:hypothetical protein
MLRTNENAAFAYCVLCSLSTGVPSQFSRTNEKRRLLVGGRLSKQ